MDAPHERALRRFVDRFVNGGDDTVLHELVHRDYVFRSPGEHLRGPDGLAALFRSYRAAFPDLRMEIDELLVAGESTVLSFTLTGTHLGDLLGIRATGRRIRVHGIVRSRFRDGKIVEDWEILDQLTLYEQLGIIGGAP